MITDAIYVEIHQERQVSRSIASGIFDYQYLHRSFHFPIDEAQSLTTIFFSITVDVNESILTLLGGSRAHCFLVALNPCLVNFAIRVLMIWIETGLGCHFTVKTSVPPLKMAILSLSLIH